MNNLKETLNTLAVLHSRLSFHSQRMVDSFHALEFVDMKRFGSWDNFIGCTSPTSTTELARKIEYTQLMIAILELEKTVKYFEVFAGAPNLSKNTRRRIRHGHELSLRLLEMKNKVHFYWFLGGI